MAKLQTITYISLENGDNIFRIDTDSLGKASVMKYTIGQDGIKINDGTPIPPNEAKYTKIVDTAKPYDITQPIHLYGYNEITEDILNRQFECVELPEDYWVDEELANKKCAYINAQPEIDAFIEKYKNLSIILPKENDDTPALKLLSLTLSRDNLNESLETFNRYLDGFIEREISFDTFANEEYTAYQNILETFDKICEYV